MKQLFKDILILFSVTGICAASLVSCSEKQPGMDLDGDAWLTGLSLDGYEGVIDRASRSVVVNVPEKYNASAMEVTEVAVSEGAEASVMEGDILDMNYTQTVTVVNGDVYMDFAVSVEHDAARILSLRLNGTYTGVIDEASRTVTVRVPTSVDVTSMTVDITLNDGAVVSPASGTVHDFTSPVEFTVTKGTATAVYTVTVLKTDNPSALYVGLAATLDGLNPEEKMAAQWMIDNVSNSQYASFDDIAAGSIDLSECEVIWWHLHIDGGIDNKEKFENAAPAALTALQTMKDWWHAGGNFLLTRYGTYYAAYLGATADNNIPNNCWGQSEETGEITTGPWSFFIQGHEMHPLYAGTITGTDEGSGNPIVYTCDTGYRITNSTAQWHIGTDWGGYADLATWRSATGATDLGYGGDGAVVAWEFPATADHGGILCIGSGCYDWYAHGIDISGDLYHGNMATMTGNAFDYLSE